MELSMEYGVWTLRQLRSMELILLAKGEDRTLR